MIIGVAKEIKPHEYRVALTPDGVRQLIGDGHRVLVEFDAGSGSGFDDQQYRVAGGLMVHRADLFTEAELLVKIKEPLPAEYDLLRRGQIVFTYLHLAPNRPLTDLLLSRGVTAFAYETLERNGTTPLLTPMSEIAGRMAPLIGSYYLQRFLGGTGILPSGVAGVGPARTLIIGAGTVGRNAACTSVGMGMETVMLNRGAERLRAIELEFHAGVRTGFLVDSVLEGELARADVVIGAVYATGGRTPLVITRQLLGIMRKGSVIVDVAIDQGGCAESSRPTSHDNPVFTVDGIIHYCVANMPGAYPRTSTLALTSATLPYIRLLARQGQADPRDLTAELRSALNIHGGEIMHPALADALK
jgi:alanine dehydrogenase